MGRFLLLIIGATALSVGLVSYASLGTERHATERRVESEQMALAREAAESGFQITNGIVARDFRAQAPVRGVAITEGTYGSYDADVTESGRGPLDGAVAGHYASAAHTIRAQFLPLTRLNAALAVDAEGLKFKPSGVGFQVRGRDHRQPGALGYDDPLMAGPAAPRPALVVPNADLQQVVLDALRPEQRPLLSGVTDQADVAVAAFSPLVHAMYEGALDGGTRYPNGTKFENVTLGAPGSPVVVLVEGDVELKRNTRGYGLLVVQGDVLFTDSARWEGVVLVQADADETLKVKLERDAQIIGSLVLYGTEARPGGGGGGLPGGHFDVDVFTRGSSGMSRAYHKHRYDDAYDVTWIDVLNGPGVSSHWSAFRQAYAGQQLRLELFNTSNGSGTLNLVSPQGSYSVPNCSAFSTTIVPNQVTTLRTNFVDLQQLRGTSPGAVKGDNPNRDRSYTIRIFEGSTLVYEVSAYEHTRTRDGYGCGIVGGPGGGSGGGGGAPGNDGGPYGRFEVEIKDRVALRYSEEAIGQVGFALAAVRAEWRVSGVVLSSAAGAAN